MALRYTIIFLFVTVIFAGVGTAPSQADAQQGFVPLTKDADKIFGQISPSGQSGSADLGRFVNNAFKIALSIGAILAVLRIGWAGYQYMTTDAWGEKSHAKEILGDVIIGLLLLFSIYLILSQINPDILNIKLQWVTPSATGAPAGGVGAYPY